MHACIWNQKESIMKFLLLLLSIVSVNGFEIHSDHESKMLLDIANSIDQPLHFISALCWEPKRTVDLIKLLNYNKYKTFNVWSKAYIQKYTTDINAHQKIMVADIERTNNTDLFLQAQELNLFRRPYRWIIFGGKYNNEISIVPKILYNFTILFDAEVLVAYSTGNKSYILHSILKADDSQNYWRTEYYGSWSELNGLKKSARMSISTATRRNGLYPELNMRVTFVIRNNNTLQHLWDYKNSHVDTLTKTAFLVMNNLMDFMRCNRTYIYTDSWGYYINGSWTGQMGYLTRGDTDLGGTPMFYLKERIPVIDYLISPIKTSSRFVFRQPPLSYDNNLYLLAFRSSVWYSILGLIFILLIALLVSAYWECANGTIQKFDGATTLKANVSDITILILGAVCQQGSPFELKSPLGRAVMFALFLTSTFLYTSYSANIVALRQYSTSNVRTLKDLLYLKLELGIEDVSYNRYFFSTATEPIRKAIYEKKVASPGSTPRYFTIEDGIKKVQSENFAFNVEIGVGYKFIDKYFYESEKCDLREISYLTDVSPWITSPKNSQYREIYLIGLSRLREHGINDREYQMFYAKKPKCTSRSGNFVSVTIIDCYPALLVLAYGSTVSLALLILEIIFYRRSNVVN